LAPAEVLVDNQRGGACSTILSYVAPIALGFPRHNSDPRVALEELVAGAVLVLVAVVLEAHKAVLWALVVLVLEWASVPWLSSLVQSSIEEASTTKKAPTTAAITSE